MARHGAPDGGAVGARSRRLVNQAAVEHHDDAVGKLEQLVQILGHLPKIAAQRRLFSMQGGERRTLDPAAAEWHPFC